MKLVVLALAVMMLSTSAVADTVHPALQAKVSGWQATDDGSLGDSRTPLAEAYQEIRSEFDALDSIDLAQVRRLTRRIQRLSKKHYRAEAVDSWPTIAQVLAADGDDCDGLELLAYWALRDAGEPVWRAVVGHVPSGAFHAVTLWGDPSDPFVLDPTGQMTKRVRKMSFFANWKIVSKFN